MPGGKRAVQVNLYERVLGASREAHTGGRYEVAYRAPMAATHAAEDPRDPGRLREVEREARRQIAHIDEHAPEHRVATASAGRHNHPGIFRMLEEQAAAKAAMAEQRRGRR